MRSLSRRQFVVGAAGFGLVVGCGRLPGQGQSDGRQTARSRRLGLLASPQNPYEDEFRQALRELGYRDGRDLIIEARHEQNYEAGTEEFRALAADLVQLPVDVIATIGVRATYGAHDASSSIPIVQVWGVGDLVGTRMVQSFARPGGNVTGMTNITQELIGKWLQLLKEAVPSIAQAAVLSFLPPVSPGYASLETTAQAAARALGIEVTLLSANDDHEFDLALANVARRPYDGLLVTVGVVMNRRRQELLDMAIERRLPLICDSRQFTALGGLMSYAGSASDNARRGAALVDKVLRGTSPAEIPVERPTRFDFVVNLKTAQALGITFPNEIMLQVTEVIQ
jgi:putative tryptophan/tyrosine transport system substrate-binding protein